MSVSINIGNVPEETFDELAARAASSCLSLQEYLRRLLIELAAKPDTAFVIRRAQLSKRLSGSRLSAKTIVSHRDADRR